MKLKFLFIFLLIPEFAFSYYVYHPCCYGFKLPCWWGNLDYLWVYRKKRFYPPLATTSTAGLPTLSNPSTEILFGDQSVGGRGKSGGRFETGFWLNRCCGFGGSIWGISEEKVKFHIEGSDVGVPIIGRPFFDTVTGTESVELVSFPGESIMGRLNIDTTNYLFGFDLYTRCRWFHYDRFYSDLLLGFAFNRLQDNLEIETSTTRVLSGFDLFMKDKFSCRNDFYAGLIGILAEYRRRSLIFKVSAKVGLGKMIHSITLSGSTIHLDPLTNVASLSTNYGLLTQPSNVGGHGKHQFEAVPQLDASLRFRIKGCLWGSVGYTSMYWRSVALAGDQVDLNINPLQNQGIGAPAPSFHEKNSRFWIQGITAGLYLGF